MKKTFLSLFALCALTASAQSEIVVGDMNDDGQLSVGDITALTDAVLDPQKQRVITMKCDPNVSDPAAIAGKWSVNGGQNMLFTEDGKATVSGNADVKSFEYYPFSRDLLLCNEGGEVVAAYHVLRIAGDALTLVQYEGTIIEGAAMPDVKYDDWTSPMTADKSSSERSFTIEYDGGDLLEFDWSVSSEEGCDFFTITLDGVEIVKASGIDSGHFSKSFTTSGTATLVAKYTKDKSGVEGADQGSIFNLVLTKGIALSTPNSFTVNGVSFNMKLVEAGTFEMGQSADGKNVTPVHSVTISQDYYIGETEVTQGLWYAVMGTKLTDITSANGWNAYGVGDSYPMYYISWNDCQDFITKLNAATGQTFRMPTEAEWEYAAKGGNKSQGYTYSGSSTIDDVAWYTGNSSSQTHPVAMKAPNELGLYDMSGNVLEWCSDWYGSYSSSAVTDTTGPTSGSDRVLRGGSWRNDAPYCRTADRYHINPTNRYNYLGFRLCLSPSK